MTKAYVNWNAGICRVIERRTQVVVAQSRSLRRATRRARKLGYDVTVYKGEYADAPRDAVRVSLGSYVLPKVRP